MRRLSMSKSACILSIVLVLAGCASPAMVSQASADGATQRLVCRVRLECPVMAARLCPGGYEIVDGDTGVIGSLREVAVACR
jgi:hypothetical protein